MTTDDTVKKEEVKTQDGVDYKDIQEKTVEQVIQNVKEEAEAAPNPIEKKAEEVTEEAPQIEKEEVDQEKLKKEVAEEVTNKIVESLKGKTTEEKTETLDEWEKFAKDTWEKEKRNPTYTEALRFVKEQAKAELKAEQEQSREESVKQEEETKRTQEENTKFINSIIDEELNELYTNNKLPKIVDKDDPNDHGIVARRVLFQTMMDVNVQRKQEGKPLIYSVHRIFNNYYKAPQQQPAGSDAPVSGGSRPTGQDDSKIDYNEIRRKSFTDLLLGK